MHVFSVVPDPAYSLFDANLGIVKIPHIYTCAKPIMHTFG